MILIKYLKSYKYQFEMRELLINSEHINYQIKENTFIYTI